MEQRLGKYIIEDMLGEGSFAFVYRAKDKDLDRHVAMKILKPIWMSDPSAVRRFKQEARTMARLDKNSHIAVVYEVGEAEGQVYLTQLLVDGETLTEKIAREGPIAWPETVSIIQDIGSALDYAHGQGVIHRDIKPSNILLDKEGKAYLGDFGLVLAAEGSDSISASVVGVKGSASYIPPEVWDAEEATAASDVYALSCVVAEMLTGQVLFEGSSMMQVMRRHDRGPEFPDTWPEGIPAGVTEVLQRGLAANPKERTQSAGELAAALAALDTAGRASPDPSVPEAVEKPAPPVVEPRPSPEAATAPPAVASQPTSPKQETIPLPAAAGRMNKGLLIGGALVIIALIGSIAFFALSGSDNSGGAVAVGPSSTSTRTKEEVTVVETVVVREEVTVIETVEVEKEVIKEVEVEKVVEVEAPAQPEGVLIVAITTFPNALTPPNAAERQAINVTNQIFDGLTFVDDDNNIVPALAESWEISDDGLEYIFNLREGVTFHNGETLDAQDIVVTWEAGKEPTNAYAYNYEEWTAVEVIDDLTVKISTEVPDPLFLRDLARQGIYPADYYTEVGFDGFEANPIGTGPFKFVEWIKGEEIVLEANERYWDEGLPKLARIVIRPIVESSARLAAVQTGEIHIATRLVAEEANQLLGNAKVNVISYPNDRNYYIAFNNLTSGVGQPTEDSRVRQALNYAVDRQAIVDALFDGQATLSSGFVSPFNLGFDESIEPYPFDPEKAKELLAEAGYPDGIEIGFACPIGAYSQFEQVCEAIGGYLNDVGVTFDGGEIQFMESGQYWDLEANKELPPMFGDAWSVTDGEALRRLEGAVLPDASYSAWGDPDLTALIEQAGSTIDTEERAAVYSEIHRYMYDNPPFIYLYYPHVFEAVNVAVQNYRPRPAEDYFLKEVFLAASK